MDFVTFPANEAFYILLKILISRSSHIAKRQEQI